MVVEGWVLPELGRNRRLGATICQMLGDTVDLPSYSQAVSTPATGEGHSGATGLCG